MELKRIIDSLVEIEDALEMRETPALLEPSLFRDTNKISLPYQVNPLTEDNLKNALWYVLEGFEVHGEVNLKGYGRIDLLCDNSSVRAGSGVMVGSGIRVGVECKADFKNIENKDINYAKSLVLNALYFASFAVGDYERSLDYLEAKIKMTISDSELSRKKAFIEEAIKTRGYTFEGVVGHMSRKYPEKYQKGEENSLKRLRVKYREGIDIPLYGVILYNPLGEMWVASGAQELIHYTSPPAEEKIKPAKEAVINYSVWKHFKDLEYIVAAERKLLGATIPVTKYVTRKGRFGIPIQVRQTFYKACKGHNKPDITAMPKSCVNETNLSKLNIIGVECKASINKDKLSKQLQSYLGAGDLSELYLAIPQVLKSRAEKLLTQQRLDTKEDLTRVGILSVNDKGEVEEIKEAKELEMKEPYFLEIEKKKVEDGRFKEMLYTNRFKVYTERQPMERPIQTIPERRERVREEPIPEELWRLTVPAGTPIIDILPYYWEDIVTDGLYNFFENHPEFGVYTVTKNLIQQIAKVAYHIFQKRKSVTMREWIIMHGPLASDTIELMFMAGLHSDAFQDWFKKTYDEFYKKHVEEIAVRTVSADEFTRLFIEGISKLRF